MKNVLTKIKLKRISRFWHFEKIKSTTELVISTAKIIHAFNNKLPLLNAILEQFDQYELYIFAGFTLYATIKAFKKINDHK